MNRKAGLFLDSVCLLLMSPLLGIVFVGMAIVFLKAIVVTVAHVAALVASIFFDVNFKSFQYEKFDRILFSIAVVLGAVGGWIWCLFEIRQKVQKSLAPNNDRIR